MGRTSSAEHTVQVSPLGLAAACAHGHFGSDTLALSDMFVATCQSQGQPLDTRPCMHSDCLNNVLEWTDKHIVQELKTHAMLS